MYEKFFQIAEKSRSSSKDLNDDDIQHVRGESRTESLAERGEALDFYPGPKYER